MACDTVVDILVRESGRYMEQLIARRVFGVSPWMTLVRRAEFPSGLGETINLLVYERSAPTEAEPTWSAMTIADGAEGGLCLPQATAISVASTTRNFSLYRRVLEGPDFCAEEQRPVFSLMQQLNSISGVLTDYVKIEWEIRDRHEYFRYCNTKVVVDDCATPTESTTMASTYPAACPTGTLPMGLLEKYRLQLIRDGAAESAMIMDNGAPILTAITSPETSGNIIRENSNLRTDMHYASMGQGSGAFLLRAFGVNHTYGGFAFLADLFPRRFSCADGAYTEIPVFSLSAATRGQKADVNSTWRTATIEESFIWDPTVFTQLIPRPITNPAANFRFDPVNYTGLWKVMNIPNRQCNPDGNILYHRAIMAAASMPNHPERGVAFAHLRCDPECSLVTACST